MIFSLQPAFAARLVHSAMYSFGLLVVIGGGN
jgi:hypothetical protein